jgi:hypothetical protein
MPFDPVGGGLIGQAAFSFLHEILCFGFGAIDAAGLSASQLTELSCLITIPSWAWELAYLCDPDGGVHALRKRCLL